MKTAFWLIRVSCLTALPFLLAASTPAATHITGGGSSRLSGDSGTTKSTRTTRPNPLSGPDKSSGEDSIVAKITDMMEKDEYRIESTSEFATLSATIAQEQKLFPKALQAAEDEWKKSQKDTKAVFAGRRLKARQIKSMGSFKDVEKAQKKLDKVEEEDRQARAMNNRRGMQKNENELEKEAELKRAMDYVQTALTDLLAKEPPPATPALGLPGHGSKFPRGGRTPLPAPAPSVPALPATPAAPGGAAAPVDPNNAPLPSVPDAVNKSL